MPPTRCVVQDCSNFSNNKAGISIHNSPKSGHLRNEWIRFVRTKRQNFKPSGRFGICSIHFESEQFTRKVHIEGYERRLIKGACPKIWKDAQEGTPQSERARRTVSVAFVVSLVQKF